MLVTMYPVISSEQPDFETNRGTLQMFTIYEDMAEPGSTPVTFDTNDFIEFQNVCEDSFPFLDYVSGSLSWGDTPFSAEQGKLFEDKYGENDAPIEAARFFNKKGLMCRESYECHPTPEYAWVVNE